MECGTKSLRDYLIEKMTQFPNYDNHKKDCKNKIN